MEVASSPSGCLIAVKSVAYFRPCILHLFLPLLTQLLSSLAVVILAFKGASTHHHQLAPRARLRKSLVGARTTFLGHLVISFRSRR